MTYASPLPALAADAARAIRYRPRVYPSQWMAAQYYIGESASESHGNVDIWYQPCNVGIIDAALEPDKRGIMDEKCVQFGDSTYFQALLGWEIVHHGGPVSYSMAKDDTARTHVLQRITPMLEHSTDLAALLLSGRANNETILSKRFTNASLEVFGSGSVNNFKSNPYRAAFADEFELMGIFPDGSDAVQLLIGRQESFTRPKLYGWSTPLNKERGIHPYILHDSDMRRFHLRCPHCRAAIYLDWHRDVRFAYRDDDPTRPIPESAALHCSACAAVITDSQRARALVGAAQRSCPWYCAETGLTPDADVGWLSVLSAEEAATRPFAGFFGKSHLYNPRKPLLDMARGWCSLKTEAQKKVYHNDILGEPYDIAGTVLTLADIEARQRDAITAHVPADTAYVTAGIDVQGGGPVGDLVFYYDVSAWQPDGHKVTIEIDRLKATRATNFSEIVAFLRAWSGTTADGKTHRLAMVVIDAGYQTRAVYHIANLLSPGGSQWVAPVIYNTDKIGTAIWTQEQQREGVGDPARAVWLTSRDHLVSRAIERIQTGRVTLPRPLPNEVAQHYVANVQVEDYDRHGNFRGYHWAKRQIAKGQILDDDWLQAAGYAEFAAVLLGLDQLTGSTVAQAHQEAANYADRKARQRPGRERLQDMMMRARARRLNQQPIR